MNAPPSVAIADAERDLLAILLSEPYAVGHLDQQVPLSVTDWSEPEHRDIYAAIRAVYERGDDPGVESVGLEMARRGTAAGLEPGTLEILAAQLVRPDQLPALGRAIKVAALRRRAEAYAERREYARAAELAAEADALATGARAVASHVNLVPLDDVQPEALRWFWADRIPYGGMTLLDGDPGMAKTTIVLDLAARYSTGRPMPDGAPSDGPGNVVLLTAEDMLAATIRPRLEAAGADLRRVHAITGIPEADGERPLSLPDDWPAIIAAAEQTGARMVLLDPLMALLSATTNSYRDQDVRRSLLPGIRAAEELGYALVVTRHLNKSQGANPLYRGGGSIGLIAAARSGMLAGLDPDDDSGERRVLAMTKHNLARRAESLSYRVASITLRDGVTATYIDWLGMTEHQASALLTDTVESEESRSALETAIDYLREALAGEPLPARDVEREARAIGISSRTLARARKQLGVAAEKRGFGREGKWYWRLPSRPKAATSTYGSLSDDPDPEVPGFSRNYGENAKAAKGCQSDNGRAVGSLWQPMACECCGGPVDGDGFCVDPACDGARAF